MFYSGHIVFIVTPKKLSVNIFCSRSMFSSDSVTVSRTYLYWQIPENPETLYRDLLAARRTERPGEANMVRRNKSMADYRDFWAFIFGVRHEDLHCDHGEYDL
jgi:hypothetical protein